MSREAIPRRAALSFTALGGILDMDQIMESDTWHDINRFMQQNFRQQVLNELSPERVAEGDEYSGEDRKTSSSRKPRAKGKSREDEEKSTETKEDGGQGSQENEKNQGKGKKGVSQKRIVDGKGKKEGKQRSVPKEKPSKTSKASNNRQKVENVLKPNAKVNSISKPTRKKAASAAKDMQATGTETVNVITNENETMITTLGSINSQLPVNTSTPKSKRAQVNDSIGEKEAEKNASGLKKAPFSTDASSKKCRATEICPGKDLSKRRDEVTVGKKKNTNASVNCETEKTKRKKENKEPPSSNTGKPLKCSKQEKKNTETGKKKIGKHEQRLIEKRKRRKERKIRRHERNAEKAMKAFEHHVTKIVTKMGYLPDSGSYPMDDSDLSDEYLSFSDSSCSCSSTCSNCSCYLNKS